MTQVEVCWCHHLPLTLALYALARWDALDDVEALRAFLIEVERLGLEARVDVTDLDAMWHQLWAMEQRLAQPEGLNFDAREGERVQHLRATLAVWRRMADLHYVLSGRRADDRRRGVEAGRLTPEQVDARWASIVAAERGETPTGDPALWTAPPSPEVLAAMDGEQEGLWRAAKRRVHGSEPNPT